eukprot:jgi/Pico_ML_1/55601/g1267.t1
MAADMLRPDKVLFVERKSYRFKAERELRQIPSLECKRAKADIMDFDLSNHEWFGPEEEKHCASRPTGFEPSELSLDVRFDVFARVNPVGVGQDQSHLDRVVRVDSSSVSDWPSVWSAMERYEKGEKLGQGQFGEVFRAVDKETGKVVAIKRVGVGSQEQGINFTALREIKLLKELQGEYIVPLVDVFLHKRNLNLVFDFMECDLEAVIKDTSLKLADADVKSYLQMTLKALEHCHKNWIVHRDVKPNNLLVSSDGMLKLTDFGLARLFGSAGMMSVEEATVPPSVTMFTPMSTEGMRDHKPMLNTVDRNYLLRRKLQMDEELNGADEEDMKG